MIYPPYIYIYGFIYTRVYINAKAPRATDKNLSLNLPPLAVALAAFTGLLSPPLASSRLLSPLLASSRLLSPRGLKEGWGGVCGVATPPSPGRAAQRRG